MFRKTTQQPPRNDVSKRLIKRLKMVELKYDEARKEYKKRRGKKRRELFYEMFKLKKEWRSIKRGLHQHFRPKILERDGYKCRACGASEKLELARLFEDSLFEKTPLKAPPEVAYSEENMFILCRECHKRFDSLNGRMQRFKEKISSIEEAMKLLRNRKPRLLKECNI
jgi:5-methylcytosine-specific restriction endonuclease McrA